MKILHSDAVNRQPFTRRPSIGLRVAVLCALASSAAALHAQTAWQGTTGSWTTAGNWTAGVPTSAVAAQINNGGTAQIASGAQAARTLFLGAGAGQSGTLEISGGSLTLAAGQNPSLEVGDFGLGALMLSAGVLTSATSYIATDPGSTGTVTVTGDSAQWNVGTFDVGSSGNGTLNVLAGGRVVSGGNVNVGNDNGAVGNIKVSGADSQLQFTAATAQTTIGAAGGSTGTVIVENGGKISTGYTFLGGAAAGRLTVQGANSSYLNNYAPVGMLIGLGPVGGTLKVLDGGLVDLSNGIASIGAAGNTGSSATIDGVDSTWKTGLLNMRGDSMTISAGGKVIGTTVAPAGGPSAQINAGVVTVMGAGSQWSIGGAYGSLALAVGNGTTTAGTLKVLGAGTVTVNPYSGPGTPDPSLADLRIGGDSTLLIDGIGSSLSVPYNFRSGMGAHLTTSVTVSGGGALNTGAAFIGDSSGSSNTVSVTGAGSTWTVADTQSAPPDATQGIWIGIGAPGELSIADDGNVVLTNPASLVAIGGFSGIQGTLDIGAPAASVARAPGTLSAGGVVFLTTTPAPTINFNHTSGAWVFAPRITGAGPGAVNALAGTTILTANSTYTGTTTISPGAALQFGNGGTIGSITGNITDNGRLLSDRSDVFAYAGIVSGSGALEQIGTGTTRLTGANTYGGATTISAGTLAVGYQNIGSIASATTVASGGTLSGSGTVSGAVALQSGGTIEPGDVPFSAVFPALTVASLNWTAGGRLRHHLGASTNLLNVQTALGKTGATPFQFVFDDSGAGPVCGMTYTLIAAASSGPFVASDFSYVYTGAKAGFGGQFAIDANKVQFTVACLLPQTISFGAQAGRTYSSGGSFAIDPLASASSGLPVTYSSLTPAVCTLSGTTVQIVSAGICTIAADQAGDGNYGAAPQVTQGVAIAKASQTITFGAQASQTYSSGGSFAIDPLASASSGLAVTYSSLTPAVCTLSGTTVQMVSVGTCTLAADQPGNGNYATAPQATANVVINAPSPAPASVPVPALMPAWLGVLAALLAAAGAWLGPAFARGGARR